MRQRVIVIVVTSSHNKFFFKKKFRSITHQFDRNRYLLFSIPMREGYEFKLRERTNIYKFDKDIV